MELNSLPSYIPILDQLLDRSPLTVTPDIPVLEVLKQMNDHPYHPVSYVVVQRGEQLVGIFTERDVVSLISSSQPLAKLKIHEVMTSPVATLKQQEYRDIYTTISLLRKQQIRHLPIVDDEGQFQGVITEETLRQMLQPINLLRLRSVAEVMTTSVIHVSPATPLLEVAQLLAQHQISCIVVAESDHPEFPSSPKPVTFPIGLITERDLLRLQALDSNIPCLTAVEVMSQPLFTIHQHDNLWRAKQQMQQYRVRRLVVTGNQGELLGIISQSNLLRLFDPAELNEIVNFLEQKVNGLEAEKQQLLEQQNQIIEERVQQRLRELQPIAPTPQPTPETRNPTEQQRTEAELQKAHQQLTFHVENSPLAVVEWDEQFRVKRWSPQAEKIFGWKAEELLNRHWNQWQFVHPEDLEQVNAIASRLLNGQESRNTCCNRNYTKQGFVVYCEWYNSVLTDINGQVVSLLSLVQDVTIRQTAQQELKRRARQQQVIAELGQYALSQTNLDALLQQVVTLVGQTLGIKYVQIWELLPNESTFLLTAGLGWRSGSVGRVTVGNGFKSQPGYTLFRQEAVIVEDLRVETRFSGCAFFYHHNIVSGVTVLIAGKDKPFGVLGIHSEQERTFSPDEINFLKASANIIASGVERQQAEDELNRFFNLSLDLFCIASTQGYFKRVNPRMISLLGYTEDELLRQSFLTLIHPDDLDSTLLELENLSLGIPSYNFENRYQCKQGSYRWLSWTAMPFDETQYYAVARDISESKQTEAALRKSEKRYATLTEVSPVGIFHCDIEGNCLYVNQRWCEISGLTSEDALGKGWAQAIHPEDRQSVAEAWHRLQTPDVEIQPGASLQKIQFCSEYRFQRQDGQITWVFGQAVGELNDQGEIIGYVGTITDISAQKQAEAELKTLNEELEVRVADRTTELSFMNEKLHRQVVELQEIESQLEDKAYQQAIVAELGQKALSETNLTALINEMVVQVSQDLNVEYCKVLEYKAEGGFLTLTVWDEPSQNYILLSHEPLVLKPLIRGKVSNTEDNLKSNFSSDSCKLEQDLEPTELHYGKFNFLNQGICIPILGQNYYHLGQIEIYGKEMQLFSEDDINYLQSVANIIATAIERKQAEEVIRKSEQLYRLMADHSTDLISRHTPLGVYLYASPASRSLLGYEPEELVGHSAYEFFHPEDLAKITRLNQNSIATADINTIVYRILRKDQQYVWFETTQKMVRDATENIQEIVAVSRDITDRKQTEEALRFSEERLKYLLSSSPGIIYSAKPGRDYQATFISDNIKTLLGYNVSEFTQPEFWLSHIHPEDIGKITHQELSPLFQQGYCSYEYRFQHQDGTYHWMYDQAKLIRDSEGNPLEIVGYWIDISDRKQAEERLKATNEQLQAVLDAVPGFVSWISNDLHYLGVNRHLANTYLLQPEDFVGQEIGFLRGSHEFAEFMEKFMREPYLNTSEVTLETQIQDATRYYLLVAQKYNQDQAAIFIGIDITERKRIEEQLWATTSRLSTLIENLQLGVLVKDEFYRIVLINQAFCDLFNIKESPDKLIGLDGPTFSFEYQNLFSDPTQFILRNQEVMRRKRVVANEELSLVDGRTFERDYVPIMIQGASQGHLWMYRDITERKKAEDTLVTSLREKEVLLKEIHHRVKNNLLVVSNLLEFQSDYVQEPELIKVLEDSRNRIYSMALIHEKLYRSTNLEKINFGDYLEDLIENLFESYNSQDGRIDFEFDIEPVGLNIETAQPCGLIVNELVSNTLKHAFPNGRSGIVYLGLHQNQEDKIIVTVRDNGIGFPEGVDFRNVESLGMELVCTLTDQLEGTITLDRENGTVFTVNFSELQYRHRL